MDLGELPVATLREVIKHVHGVDARWVERVAVTDDGGARATWPGWTGEVQVFELVDHPKARRCYVWSYPAQGGLRRFLAVLEEPPVHDAPSAVRAQMAADAHKKN
jgi:hypothetical protein